MELLSLWQVCMYMYLYDYIFCVYMLVYFIYMYVGWFPRVWFPLRSTTPISSPPPLTSPSAVRAGLWSSIARERKELIRKGNRSCMTSKERSCQIIVVVSVVEYLKFVTKISNYVHIQFQLPHTYIHTYKYALHAHIQTYIQYPSAAPLI